MGEQQMRIPMENIKHTILLGTLCSAYVAIIMIIWPWLQEVNPKRPNSPGGSTGSYSQAVIGSTVCGSVTIAQEETLPNI